ncbi:hypothetical protein TNCT_373151 [Trichonephila clavata]|uniref:Uncharacterized protein n=1 Tax=Trichonephila clavata TaxID=2740835 RepID=A0A8X6KVT5_TRICU|nr:hypothetical protein TNCT_373151 [Trichonephila clavata]
MHMTRYAFLLLPIQTNDATAKTCLVALSLLIQTRTYPLFESRCVKRANHYFSLHFPPNRTFEEPPYSPLPPESSGQVLGWTYQFQVLDR